MRATLLSVATLLLLIACNSGRTRGAVPDSGFIVTDAGDDHDGGNNTTVDMNVVPRPDMGPDVLPDMHVEMPPDMGVDASMCVALQPAASPCCTSLGADACDFGLFCAALDGPAICYAQHSRMPGETCTEDIQCESGFMCSTRGVCEAPCGVTPGVYVQTIEARPDNTCELLPSGALFDVHCEGNVLVWCRQSDGFCLEQENNEGDLSTNDVLCFDPVPVPGSILSTRSFEFIYTSACDECVLDAHLRYDRE